MNIKICILVILDFFMNRLFFYVFILKYCYVFFNLWLDECIYNKLKKLLRIF